MADIFDEIEDELKQDRMANLWSKYGVYLIAAAIAVVVSVAGYQGYQSWQLSSKTSAADSYHTALQSEDVLAGLATAKTELTGGYNMLAGFSEAGLLAEAGDPAAEQAYVDLSSDPQIEPLYQDMALLLSVMVADNRQSSQALLDRLSPLMSTANALQGLALEQGAALEIRSGNMDNAKQKLEQITNLTEISATLRRRAEQLLTILDN